MCRKIFINLMLMCAFSAIAAAQDAKNVLEATIKNLGDIKSIQYSGSGATFSLGQGVNTDLPGPKTEIKSFTRTIDYDKSASRQEAVGPNGPLQTQFVAGDKAWGVSGTSSTPPAAPAVLVERQLQILLTPHGFLKGALANNATVKRGKITQVTFTALGKYRVVGTISADNLVEKVETWLYNPVLGDMPVETVYSDYRDFDGIKFPTKIAQKQGGFPVLEQAVTSAKANIPLEITVPDVVRQATSATPATVQVKADKLADGVWYLTGGTHHSVLVEFADHVAVIEAPLNEDRSSALI